MGPGVQMCIQVMDLSYFDLNDTRTCHGVRIVIIFLLCTRKNGVYEGILGYFMHSIVIHA